MCWVCCWCMSVCIFYWWLPNMQILIIFIISRYKEKEASTILIWSTAARLASSVFNMQTHAEATIMVIILTVGTVLLRFMQHVVVVNENGTVCKYVYACVRVCMYACNKYLVFAVQCLMWCVECCTNNLYCCYCCCYYRWHLIVVMIITVLIVYHFPTFANINFRMLILRVWHVRPNGVRWPRGWVRAFFFTSTVGSIYTCVSAYVNV